jgi:calcium-dependent protein kinase
MKSRQVSQLECEIEIFLSMNHPHVADLVDVYRGKQQLDLVMECLSGGEVLDRVLEEEYFGEGVTADTLRQMLLAVNYLHAHNIVHRDLKLENFLYEKPGGDHLKLIDFGFSRVWSSDQSSMGIALGSLYYVAPEVLDKKYGTTCDLWSMGVIAFVLLTGCFPFAGSTRSRVIKRIRAGDRDELPFGKLSKVAEDFVDALLVVDPATRLTAEKALRHPFIEGTFETVRESRSRSLGDVQVCRGVSKALTDFAQASHFRRVCMSFMAWSLTSEEQAHVRDEFMAIDESRQGTLTLEEMVKALKKSGVDEEQARGCFRALDVDKTGHIKYSEFLAAMVSTRIAMHDELIRRTFHRFDKGDTGSITLDDLRKVLGESFEGTEVEELLKEADFKNDGKISFEEFTQFLMGEVELAPKVAGPSRCRASVKVLDDQARELRKEFITTTPPPSRKGTDLSTGALRENTEESLLCAQGAVPQPGVEAPRKRRFAGCQEGECCASGVLRLRSGPKR